MIPYTPGPWIPISHPSDLSIFIHKLTDLGAPHIAEVPVLFHHHEDARLIAEAPVLYECLKYLFKNVRLDISEYWESRITETLYKVEHSIADRTKSMS